MDSESKEEKQKDNGDESSIKLVSFTIPTYDPFTKERLKFPVRSKNCKLHGCFEREFIEELLEESENEEMNCPLC